MVSKARLPSSSQSGDGQRPCHPGWLGPPSHLPASRTQGQARVRVCSEFSASAWPVTKAAGPKRDRKGWDLALAWGAAQGSPGTKQPGACPILGGEGKLRAQRWARTRRILAWALGLHHLPVPSALRCWPVSCHQHTWPPPVSSVPRSPLSPSQGWGGGPCQLCV